MIPKLVALCGWPQSGKTTLAEYLSDEYGAQVVDDGAILREACMALYGLDWGDLYTQEGKAKTIKVCDKVYTHRQLAGHLGNLLEQFYGEQFVPEQTLRRLLKHTPELDGAPFYVFPSVRRTQGITWRNAGGMVVAIERPGLKFSGNDFDAFDESLVDRWIVNGGTVEDMCQQAKRLFDALAKRAA